MVKAIHHIGIAVPSIEAQRAFYEHVLGGRFEGIEEIKDQKVRVAFFVFGPEEAPIRLELLEPTAADSTIARHLEKRGAGLHHLAFAVDRLEDRLAELRSKGFALIDEQPRRGAHGNLIAFLHPKGTHSVLTELCEPRTPH